MSDRDESNLAEKAVLWRALRQHFPVDELAELTGSSSDAVSRLLDEITRLVEREWDVKQGVLFFDGAARGNPGPAGIGAVLYDASGRQLATISGHLGQTTNNVAEYQALTAALRKARDLGLSRIEIRTDSELVNKQITGQYRVKSRDLIPLWQEALNLLNSFAKWEITRISRSENKDADRLANQAIDIYEAGQE